MRARPASRLVPLLLAVLLGAGLVASPASPASAASGIDHVESFRGELRLLLSVDDLPAGTAPDLDGVEVTFDDTALDAVATPLRDAETAVRRTVVLAVDVSASPGGARLATAKAAAQSFLAGVPDDVRVGLVTYAGRVEVAQEPTSDTAAVARALEDITASRGTRLHDGVQRAVAVAGDEGARTVLALSQGPDTSGSPVAAAAATIRRSTVKVDVLALAPTAPDEALLQQLARAGNGSVERADDPAALTRLVADEAAGLARQVLVTATAPAGFAGEEGSLAVTVPAGAHTVVDKAFVSFPDRAGTAAAPAATASPALGRVSEQVMLVGLAAAGVAIAVLLVLAFGGSRGARPDAVERRIEAYTRAGAHKRAEAAAELQAGSRSGRRVVAVAESVLEGRQGLEAALARRLDGAGLALRPAEWLLAHAGATVLAGLLGLLLSGGGLLVTLVMLLLGAGGPWAFLLVRRTGRLRAFGAGLADTLQLMSGSLSAGLSLAQSVDAVVQEGSDPIAGEFRRALVEARLGVEIEDSLAGVAERMHSVDFQWVVMAIRIQRDIGGNLSELLMKVAETIREREYLVRQVKTLSAEGRLSVWILGGLPPAFTAYLALANPHYLAPMFASAPGLVLVGLMVVLLVAGVAWMKKVAKVDV